MRNCCCSKTVLCTLPKFLMAFGWPPCIDISYTLDSASVYQKVKSKISAAFSHNNGQRPYLSFHSDFVHFRNTKYKNYHGSCQFCGNDQCLRPGFNFRLPTVWDTPSSIYEISMPAWHHIPIRFPPHDQRLYVTAVDHL